MRANLGRRTLFQGLDLANCPLNKQIYGRVQLTAATYSHKGWRTLKADWRAIQIDSQQWDYPKTFSLSSCRTDTSRSG